MISDDPVDRVAVSCDPSTKLSVARKFEQQPNGRCFKTKTRLLFTKPRTLALDFYPKTLSTMALWSMYGAVAVKYVDGLDLA